MRMVIPGDKDWPAWLCGCGHDWCEHGPDQIIVGNAGYHGGGGSPCHVDHCDCKKFDDDSDA